MEIIEVINCKSFFEAKIRETYWIDLLKPTLNTQHSVSVKYYEMKQYQNDLQLWKENIKETNTEFLDRAILPKHIYLYRPILREMLKIKFGKRVFKKMDKTELITNSYSFFNHIII
jgi:hypothetical protein